MKNIVFLILLLVCFGSCSNYPLGVEESLLLSGNNRDELEKVLNHYKYKGKVPYKSACFLIENMKYHESKHIITVSNEYHSFFQLTDSIYKAIFKDMTLPEIKVYNGREYDSLRTALEEKFSKLPIIKDEQCKTMPDLETVTSEFLIDNIDQALEIWKAKKYNYDRDFDFFKEFILAYRVTDEYHDMKRSTLLSMYSEVLADSINNSIYKKIEQYKVYVNKCRWINKNVKAKSHIGIYDLFIPKFKMDCHNMTNWSCNIFRSNGIPTVYEFTPLWKERDSKHFWCVSPDSAGILQPYTAPDNNLREDWDSDIKYAGKVYRKTFGAQKNTPYFLANTDEYIPALFRKPLLIDQTYRYHQSVTLRLPFDEEISNNLAYLCMLSTDRMAPVAWGKIDHKKHEIIFEQVPLNTLFFPICYDEETMLNISEPFMIYSSGNVSNIPLPLTTNVLPRNIVDLSLVNGKLVWTSDKMNQIQNMKYITLPCDTNKHINLHLLSKYPEKRRLKSFRGKLKGAILLGSNHARKNYDTLLILKTAPKPYLQDVGFENKNKYRYYRFITADKSPVNIAHIEFLTPYVQNRNGVKPTRLPIFSEADRVKSKDTKETLFRIDGEPFKTGSHPEYAFDNDPRTYLGATSLGVDLKAPVQITHIRFLPRTANNMIVSGDSYLLLYFDNGWREFKTLYAESEFLDFYNVPAATLFLLRNLTEGKEEFPFFYIRGKQYYLHTDTLPGNFETYE